MLEKKPKEKQIISNFMVKFLYVIQNSRKGKNGEALKSFVGILTFSKKLPRVSNGFEI
jgi:hypothetical protein